MGNVPVPVPGGGSRPGLGGEVAAYIGKRVESADEAAAEDAIFGYSTFNDITARRAQKLTSQWTLGKNGDFTGPWVLWSAATTLVTSAMASRSALGSTVLKFRMATPGT